MSKTIAIIGGSQKSTFKNIGNKHGVDIIFHCGKTRNGGKKKEFKTLINKADCVVLLWGALGHISQELVKEICKEEKKPILFHRTGATGAINKGVNFLNSAA